MGWYKNHPSECPLIWIDTETGGLDTSKAALLEVAVIVTDIKGQDIYDRWESRVLRWRFDDVDPVAADINGYDEALWGETAMPLPEAVQRISALARGCIFAGHNVPFDYAMVMRVFREFEMYEWPGPHWKVDTVGLAWPLLADRTVPDLKLTTLTKHLGIPHENAHRAMADCEATRLVYCELMDRYAKGQS